MARRVLLTLGPPLGLLVATVVVFWRDLFEGAAYFGSDTLAFYYPLTTWYAEQLRTGEFPRWVPFIFGGYPIFADGETGMLYPPNLIAFTLLPPDRAFVLLRPLHLWLAGLFAYWLARLLGARRFGAFIAGLTFSYGGFLVAHLQHENIIRGAVWLPLVIGFFELAMRAAGRRRVSWLLACGLVVGIQLLGVHIQPVLLTLAMLGLYALPAPLGRAADGPHYSPRALLARPPRLDLRRLMGYLGLRLGSFGLVTLVGLGLGAVQLLPLYQLAERSLRFGNASYEFATSFSVPPPQLIQLLLPYLFRSDGSPYWGLWSATETTLYVGVGSLLLALVGVAYLRTRAALFFGVVAGGSLLLTLGDYLPLRLYGLIASAPGFSFLRVPARFSLLFTLAVGLLAAFAADWLAGRAFDRRHRARARLRVRRLLLISLGCAASALALATLFWVARVWLEADARVARQLIVTYYLSVRRGELGLSPAAVYVGLLRALDFGNPWTIGGLALMVVVSVLLLLRGCHLAPRRLWQVALIGVVAIDLITFARHFNPEKPVDQFRPTQPAIRFLAERNGLQRVFVEPQLNALFGPNQLVSYGIDAAGGYSSLEPRRASEYWWSIVRQDNVLLDLYNVRYVVAPQRPVGLLAYEGVLYHPADRLMRGSVGNPSGLETFSFRPAWTTALTVIAAAEGIKDVPYGEPLAEISLKGPNGERQLLLRAGQDVEDTTSPLFGPPDAGLQARPRIVWAGASFQNPRQLSALSGTTFRLAEPLMVTSLTIRRVGPPGALDVYGLGLDDREGLPVRSLASTDRAKYRPVYQDDDVRILENTASLPRAFLVGSARPIAGGPVSVADQMLLGPFDPRRTILVEPGSEPFISSDAESVPGTATVLEYGPDRVVVRVEADAAGYLVLTDRYEEGWRATIGGTAAPLLRADAIFRAVPIGPGSSIVAFNYDPPGVLVGAAISAVTLVVVLAFGLWLAVAPARPRRPGLGQASLEVRPR